MIDAATILVADDSADDVELLKRAIQKAGIKNPIRSLTDGLQVIDFLKDSSSLTDSDAACPLLMLLDLNMPRCTGFAVLRWLREQPHLQNLPIIVVSNSDQPSDIEKSFRLGAHGYWVKPSRFEDLQKLALDLKERLTDVVRRVALEPSMAVPA